MNGHSVLREYSKCAQQTNSLHVPTCRMDANPTTKVLRSDEETHTNRLINETSPYLLQHAHNPVDWYPWGEEAFEVARRDQKPILVEHRLLGVSLVPRHGARVV